MDANVQKSQGTATGKIKKIYMRIIEDEKFNRRKILHVYVVCVESNQAQMTYKKPKRNIYITSKYKGFRKHS